MLIKQGINPTAGKIQQQDFIDQFVQSSTVSSPNLLTLHPNNNGGNWKHPVHCDVDWISGLSRKVLLFLDDLVKTTTPQSLSDMKQALNLVHGIHVCSGCMREAVVALSKQGMVDV
jgi:hypothetical protein